MEIGKEYLASGLDSFPFLCYHALFLPILLIFLSFGLRSSLNKTSLTNLTSFFLYHPSTKKTLTLLPNCQNDIIFPVITV